MLSSIHVNRLRYPPSETRWTAMVKAVTTWNPMLSWHEFMSGLANGSRPRVIGSIIAIVIRLTNMQ
jgi:hypothetical protein